MHNSVTSVKLASGRPLVPPAVRATRQSTPARSSVAHTVSVICLPLSLLFWICWDFVICLL